MQLSNEDIILIDRYIDGELSEEEKTILFERQKDLYFKEEFDIRSGAAEAIHTLAEVRLRGELKSQLRNIDLSEQSGRYNLFYWVAAAVTLIFMVIWVFPGTETPESLFQAYYKPYPANIHTRGDAPAVISAFEAYEKGKFEEASDLIKSAIATQDESASSAHLELLLGNCYLNTNNYPLAEETFGRLQPNDDLMVRDHAEWFLALTYLKKGQVDRTHDVLDRLVTTESLYKSNAKRLLKELGKLPK